MPDREKVIALLERYVRIPNLAGAENYGAKIVDMPAPLITDALALLKEQDPRVMTLEEWREWKRKPLSQRDPVYYVDNKEFGSWIAPNDQLFIYATPELGYGVLFVCWTSRPTHKQRMETLWKPQSTIRPAGTTEGVQ
jgi:hypothetical protein